MLLCKGFEVEMYTGRPDGTIVGLSDRIVRDLQGFVREPDTRNVEYTTAPLCCYDRLLCALVRPRVQLRHYLKKQGDYTLIPGSTLALGGSDRFYRSDPQNPYHEYIEKTYGTKVVTASIHINVGFEDTEKLMQACRLIRLEAPLYLALSASSPFLDGQPTGYHSTRWAVFPQTPAYVPLFEDHAHHIRWVNQQLDQGTMQNVRHLWLSVRPNGEHRPYNLNRLELRICDLIVDPIALLSVTALLEARLTQMLLTPDLDPLQQSQLPAQSRAEDLVAIAYENEQAVARKSLAAEVRHWQDGRPIIVEDWIKEIYRQVHPIAKAKGFSCFLSPVQKILRDGNTAQQWLREYEKGTSVTDIVTEGIRKMAHEEAELEDKICQPLAV
ncbi:MAG: glutamate--cysteine ligase [Cyanobacteria bacterium]|nr:glutamate--cysteine ligase [Cyanobacteria bacterium GSL.Bin1]